MSASAEKARYGLSDTAVPDWSGVAASAWEAPSWKLAAREYHDARDRSGDKPQPPDPQLLAPIDRKVSPEQAQRKLLERRRDGAAASSVEALMFALRRSGEALTNPNNQHRLSELSETQLHQVCARLQNFKPEIARPWTTDEVEVLAAIWRDSHHG
jgi:hypothetical protein